MTERGNGPDDAIRVPGTDRVFNRQLMLVPLLAILAMTMMAISSINVALPSIELSIGASEADLQWLLSGYALAFGIVLVASGRLGDVFGRSTYFVIGVALFTLGSLGCSLAHTPALLNGMRLLQGVGAGVSSPQVNGMILQYFSGRRRARAVAMEGQRAQHLAGGGTDRVGPARAQAEFPNGFTGEFGPQRAGGDVIHNDRPFPVGSGTA